MERSSDFPKAGPVVRDSSLNRNTRFYVDPRISSERRQQLQTAFNEIDKDQSGKLSFQEIFTFLQGVSKDVDESYVRGLFNSMDSNKDGQVSIQEFLEHYLEQVNLLSQSVTKLQQSIGERRREQAKLSAQLEQAQKVQKLNSWGVMEGSIMSVRVIEAQNLSGLTGKPSAFVNLLCERQQIATKVVRDKDPVWNQNFSFKITSGTGELLLQVYNQGTVSKDDLLGSCSLPIQEFRDQARHQRCLCLDGRASSARLLLEAQWIHRRTVYLQGLINEMEADISKEEAEKSELEGKLLKAGTDPLGMFVKDSWMRRVEGKIIDEVKEFTSAYLAGVTAWGQVQRLMLGLFVVLIVLMSAARTDMFNATWGCFVLMKELSGFSVRDYVICVAGLACLIVSDFLWIADDFELLIFEVHNDPFVNLERFSFVVAFFNFLLKVMLVPVVVKNYISLKHR